MTQESWAKAGKWLAGITATVIAGVLIMTINAYMSDNKPTLKAEIQHMQYFEQFSRISSLIENQDNRYTREIKAYEKLKKTGNDTAETTGHLAELYRDRLFDDALEVNGLYRITLTNDTNKIFNDIVVSIDNAVEYAVIENIPLVGDFTILAHDKDGINITELKQNRQIIMLVWTKKNFITISWVKLETNVSITHRNGVAEISYSIPLMSPASIWFARNEMNVYFSLFFSIIFLLLFIALMLAIKEERKKKKK